MKRALVTGGSGPIGAEIARRLGARGVHVILHARSGVAKAEAAASQIRADGGSAEVVVLDLSDHEPAAETLEQLADAAPIQILVHAAGMQRDVPFAGMSLDDWQAVIDVNLTGFYTALRPLILPMMRTRWGRIVAISSLTAITGNRGQTNYAAAKGGLLAMVKSLTREYGARGITANVVAPGLIATPETEALENAADLIAHCPMRRSGTPAEVAAAVDFLTSEEASYISGQMLAVDGGTS